MASTEDKPANKENASSWKDSIYNPRTGELLGRTASSWGKDPPIISSHLGDALTATVSPPLLTPSHIPYLPCSSQWDVLWMGVNGCPVDAALAEEPRSAYKKM